MEQNEIPKSKRSADYAVKAWTDCRKLAYEIYEKRYPGKRKREIEMLKIRGEEGL